MLEDYNVGYFGDERLKKNGALLFERMHRHKTVCLHRLGGNRATEVNKAVG